MIGRDAIQWILSTTPSYREDGVEWKNRTFHPNLTNLLDELAETYFKKNSKKISEIKELDKAITKTYKLIADIGESPGGEALGSPRKASRRI